MGVFSLFGCFFTPPLVPDMKSMPLGACFSCSVSPLTPNIETTPIWACFRCSAASLPHPSCRTRRACPWGHVFCVRCLLHLAPHIEHEKRAPMGTFFVYGVLLSLTPPAEHRSTLDFERGCSILSVEWVLLTTLEIEHSRSTFALDFEDGGALPVSHPRGEEGCTLFVSFFHSDEVEGMPPRLAAI